MNVVQKLKDGAYDVPAPENFSDPAVRRKWREDTRQKERVEFRKDLLEELGVPADHPKADLLWTMAWDRGHSSGLYAVRNEAIELVELIK